MKEKKASSTVKCSECIFYKTGDSSIYEGHNISGWVICVKKNTVNKKTNICKKFSTEPVKRFTRRNEA